MESNTRSEANFSLAFIRLCRGRISTLCILLPLTPPLLTLQVYELRSGLNVGEVDLEPWEVNSIVPGKATWMQFLGVGEGAIGFVSTTRGKRVPVLVRLASPPIVAIAQKMAEAAPELANYAADLCRLWGLDHAYVHFTLLYLVHASRLNSSSAEQVKEMLQRSAAIEPYLQNPALLVVILQHLRSAHPFLQDRADSFLNRMSVSPSYVATSKLSKSNESSRTAFQFYTPLNVSVVPLLQRFRNLRRPYFRSLEISSSLFPADDVISTAFSSLSDSEVLSIGEDGGQFDSSELLHLSFTRLTVLCESHPLALLLALLSAVHLPHSLLMELTSQKRSYSDLPTPPNFVLANPPLIMHEEKPILRSTSTEDVLVPYFDIIVTLLYRLMPKLLPSFVLAVDGSFSRVGGRPPLGLKSTGSRRYLRRALAVLNQTKVDNFPAPPIGSSPTIASERVFARATLLARCGKVADAVQLVIPPIESDVGLDEAFAFAHNLSQHFSSSLPPSVARMLLRFFLSRQERQPEHYSSVWSLLPQDFTLLDSVNLLVHSFPCCPLVVREETLPSATLSTPPSGDQWRSEIDSGSVNVQVDSECGAASYLHDMALSHSLDLQAFTSLPLRGEVSCDVPLSVMKDYLLDLMQKDDN